MAGPRILVVDDEPDIVDSLVDLLHLMMPEAVIEAAGSGEQALQKLRKTPVDLLVTDFKMPGINGVQLVHEARRLSPGMPNILVTAYGIEVVEEAGPPPPDRVLNKPVDIDAFQGAVNQALATA